MITPECAIKHNVKIKSFPLAEIQKMTVCSDRIFRESGWELLEDKPSEPKPQNLDNDSRADSTRRAKNKVFELAMLNQFTHFITWTLDKQEIDRYDAKEVSQKLNIFCEFDICGVCDECSTRAIEIGAEKLKEGSNSNA